MTYLPELRNALLDAAHRQPAQPPDGAHQRSSSTARWRRSVHYGRTVLASVALGLTGTAAGAIHIGAPLGPEPPPSPSITQPAIAPASVEPRP